VQKESFNSALAPGTAHKLEDYPLDNKDIDLEIQNKILEMK